MRESVGRILQDLKRRKGNVLILTLNVSGGDMKIARDLADDCGLPRPATTASSSSGSFPRTPRIPGRSWRSVARIS